MKCSFIGSARYPLPRTYLTLVPLGEGVHVGGDGREGDEASHALRTFGGLLPEQERHRERAAHRRTHQHRPTQILLRDELCEEGCFLRAV
jgi:hypothetical protein